MEPTYLQNSPSVLGFNYETGEWDQTAYGGFGQLELESSQPPNHVVAEPYPHPSSVYPSRQPHEIVTTGPLLRGDPNMPAYAPAPHIEIGQDQQAHAGPQNGAYAGSDFGAAEVNYAKPGFGSYRDVKGSGNWVYRQFRDGVIQIVVSQDRQMPVGTLLSPNPQVAGHAQWNAITGEIGTWQMYASQRGSAIAKALVDSASAASGSLKTQKRKKRHLPAPPMPVSEPIPEETSGIPSWAILVGVAALAGGALYLATRPEKKHKGDK